MCSPHETYPDHHGRVVTHTEKEEVKNMYSDLLLSANRLVLLFITTHVLEAQYQFNTAIKVVR